MDTKEITSLFGLDFHSTLPLKEQLARKIGAFIESSPAGTLLPSERSLAEVLQVSRVTVRAALKKFFVSGRLVSCGRNGTKVAENPLAFDHLDPAVFGIPLPRVELHFLCYENMPHQQEYWQSTVARYNRLNPGRRVRINFVDSNSCPFAFEYPGGDIITVPLWVTAEQREEYFQKLPDDFSHPAEDPAFLQSLFSKDEEFAYFVPVFMQHRQLIWNRKLADICGFSSLSEEIKQRGFFGITRAAHEKLPGKYRIGGHVWDLLNFSCVPENGRFPETALEILEEIAALPSDERIFFTSQRHSFDMVENFWQGKQLYTDIIANFHAYLGNPSFPLEKDSFPLPERGKKIVWAMRVGISKHCKDPGAAADFIAFLLSDEIQSGLAERKHVLSLKNEYLKAFLRERYFSSEEALEKYCASLRFPAGKYASMLNWMRFATYDIRQEIVMVMRKQLPLEEAVKKIQEKWCRKQLETTESY